MLPRKKLLLKRKLLKKRNKFAYSFKEIESPSKFEGLFFWIPPCGRDDNHT